MKFRFSSGSLAGLPVEAIGIAVFEGESDRGPAFNSLDGVLRGALSAAVEGEAFKGKPEQSLSVHANRHIKARKVVLVGVGARGRLSRATLRAYASRVVRSASKARKIALAVPHGDIQLDEFGIDELAAGTVLGAYRFDKYRTRDVDPPRASDVILWGAGRESKERRRLADGGVVMAESVALARDLVNEPAITLTPRALAGHARAVAKETGLSCQILGLAEIRKLKMGCLLGVAQGSAEEPRVIHLSYRPKGANRKTPQVALVGKGLTFDSGGLSLKPPKSMEDMKCDMAGAAAVLGAMKVVGALKPRVAVHGFIGTTENMPGGRAVRPGDILRSMSGKSVEVLNTDAEGRLVLADVIHYANTKKVDEIIDLATLTGACMVALGRHTAGFFSNNDEMGGRYQEAAKVAGEDAWRMPLTEKLAESLRSTVADIKNIGDSYGGAITAALFLKEFVGETPWVHVDIAGPAFANGKGPNAGGTGYGVLTLVRYLMSR